MLDSGKIGKSLLLAMAVMLSCSQQGPSEVPDGGGAVLDVSLLKSSLARQISQVSLEVLSAGEVVYTDEADVTDGAFAFEQFELPAGEATIRLSAADQSGNSLYYGDTTITIIPDTDNPVSIMLLPAVPMAKLSPYHAVASTGEEFISYLEFFNIEKFFNGSFRIVYDTNLLAFDGVVHQADPSWGGLLTFSREVGDTIVLSLSRTQGNSDVVADGANSIVNLAFRARKAGTTVLSFSVVVMEDLDGPIQELPDVYIDSQTLIIVSP